MFQLLPNHSKLHQIHKKYAVFSESIHRGGGWLVTQTSFLSHPHSLCVRTTLQHMHRVYVHNTRQAELMCKNRFAIITVSFQMTNQFTAESRLINLPLAIF